MSANINDPRFDEPREHPGFRARRARLGRQVGSVQVGASLWELPPGETAYPYHHHLVEEELVIVMRGRPSLRTPAGWRELAEGEVVCFPVGEQGAHQIANRTEEPVRFLAVSNQAPEIVVYPDADKIGVSERRPDGSGLHLFFRRDDAIDYWDGETAPGA